VGKDERRPLRLFDYVSDRKGLAAAGDAEQDLVLYAFVEAFDQLPDGLGLVAFRLILRDETELHSSIMAHHGRIVKSP
jgi:hypothetical protein